MIKPASVLCLHVVAPHLGLYPVEWGSCYVGDWVFYNEWERDVNRQNMQLTFLIRSDGSVVVR